MSATRLTLSGSETVIVYLPLAKTRDLLQRGLIKRLLWEIKSPDGKHLVINPYQVQYLQDADE